MKSLREMDHIGHLLVGTELSATKWGTLHAIENHNHALMNKKRSVKSRKEIVQRHIIFQSDTEWDQILTHT